MAGGGDVPPSNSCHTLVGSMSKPERGEEQGTTATDGCESDSSVARQAPRGMHIVYFSSEKLVIVPKINWKDDLGVQAHEEGGKRVICWWFFSEPVGHCLSNKERQPVTGAACRRPDSWAGCSGLRFNIWCCSEWQRGLYRLSQSRRCAVHPLLERCWLTLKQPNSVQSVLN